MQRAVISALSSLPVADRVETVTRRMLQAGNKDYLYYLVLASTGQPDALATVVKGFRSNTGVKRDAAVEALLNWKGIEVADGFLYVC